MHHRSWLTAALSACALLALAPHARADGFYVTFTNQNGSSLVARLPGAVFDATGQMPVDAASGLPTGRLNITPVHVEVDNLQVLVPLLGVLTNNRGFGATVEFNDSRRTRRRAGVHDRQVHEREHHGLVDQVRPDATSTIKNAVDFSYETVTYSAPPAPAPAPGVAFKKAPVLRAVTKTAPIILRLALPSAAAQALPPAHVDDAYFQATGIPGESSAHAVRPVSPRSRSRYSRRMTQPRAFPLAS